MLPKHKRELYRATCELHVARDKLINYLSKVSRQYYNQEVPPRVVQYIWALVSDVVIKEDNWRSIYEYGVLVNHENGIS